jgi:hypothetical protein
MPTRSLFLVLCTLSLLAGCKRDCPDIPPPSVVLDDIPAVKLREMTVSRLPSPFYQFFYNDSGYILRLNYSSGLMLYDVTYSGKRIQKIEANKEIQADINKDRLDYEYLNGQPSVIKVVNKNGILYRKCLLTFSSDRQLQKLQWEVDPGGGFVPEQTLQFRYFADGNLQDIAYHNFAVGPQLESNYEDHFEQYDNKINADGFALLHTSTHHPVLLPATRLQLNNPGRVYRTGTNVPTFDARYNYFNDGIGRPLIREGTITFKELNGATGQFQSVTTYSY